MKTITTYVPSGGPTSSSPSGSRPVRDPALSRPLPKRFRPGGAAPLRKKSFRHHLDQTLGKEGVSPVVPVASEPPPAVSPKSLSPGGKAGRPKSRTALRETLIPETPSKPAALSPAPARVAPGHGSVRKENALAGGVRTENLIGKDFPGVGTGKSAPPVGVARNPAPSDIVPETAESAFLRTPDKKDPASPGTGGLVPPSGQPGGKPATLPAKGASPLKEKGAAEISPSRRFPEAVQNVLRQDETVSEVPRKENVESFFEEKMPEEEPGSAPLKGGGSAGDASRNAFVICRQERLRGDCPGRDEPGHRSGCFGSSSRLFSGECRSEDQGRGSGVFAQGDRHRPERGRGGHSSCASAGAGAGAGPCPDGRRGKIRFSFDPGPGRVSPQGSRFLRKNASGSPGKGGVFSGPDGRFNGLSGHPGGCFRAQCGRLVHDSSLSIVPDRRRRIPDVLFRPGIGREGVSGPSGAGRGSPSGRPPDRNHAASAGDRRCRLSPDRIRQTGGAKNDRTVG